MAAGPLACYLYERMNQRRDQFVIEQGRLMSPPSPSELIARLQLEGMAIEQLLVGGRATVMREVEVDLQR